MAIPEPFVVFSPNDLDRYIRNRADNKLSLVNSIYVSNIYSNKTISHDSNHEYTFSNENFNFRKNNYQVFYDGENKIFESFWREENSSLSIKIFTTTQTNLFFDVEVNELIIESQANLCIDSQLNIQNLISITSYALCVVDKLICSGDINFKVDQSCILLSEVKANTIGVKSAFLHLNNNFESEDLIDISVQAFQQTENASVSTNNFRLVSEQCEIVGDFEVVNTAFLAANHLYFGKNNYETNFFCDGECYIHSINTVIYNNVEIGIGNSQNVSGELINHFIIDGSFLLSSGSKFECNNALIECDRLSNEGECQLNNARVLSSHINNSNTLLTNATEIIVSGSLIAQNRSRINLSASEFRAKEAHINSGNVFLNDCLWEISHLSIHEASFYLENKSEIIAKDLNAENKNCNFSIIGSSKLRTINEAVFDCKLVVKDSILDCRFFSSYNHSELKKSKLKSGETVTFNGTLIADDLATLSKTIRLKGQIDINNSIITSKHASLFASCLSVRTTILNSSELLIEGGSILNTPTIDSSDVSFKRLTIKDRVMFLNSDLFGVDDDECAHDIKGTLVLKKSRFVTDSQIHSSIKAKIKELDGSKIYSGLLYSQSEIESIDSSIRSTGYLSSEGQLDSSNSSLNFGDSFITIEGANSLTNTSLVANSASLEARSHLKLTGKSLLIMRQSITASSATSLTSSGSTIVSTEFVSCGETELKESLLCAEELRICQGFLETNKSIVNVKEKIAVAEQAKMSIVGSLVEGGILDVEGKLVLDSSQANLKQNANLSSSSVMAVAGGSEIAAENIAIKGQVIPLDKHVNGLKLSQEAYDASKLKSTALQLKAKKTLDLSSSSSIEIKGCLSIDASNINQDGHIIIDGQYVAKGEVLNHNGDTTASSIYCGIDYYTMNYGMLAADTITVHSSFANVFGTVYAKKSLATSGIGCANVGGLIAANNYMNDSFLSLNAGLISPNFAADWSDILTVNNLITSATTLATTLLPAYANSIRLLSMLPGMIPTIQNLYAQSNSFSFDKLSEMRPHEYIPLFCQVKSAAMFGYGAYSSAAGTCGEFSTYTRNAKSLWANPTKWGRGLFKQVKEVKWDDVGLQVAGSLAGTYNDTSLIHANIGFSLAANTSKTNLIHFNSGYERSLFSHSINTLYMQNQGSSGGTYTSIAANQINNTGVLSGEKGFALKSKNVHNSQTGIIDAKSGAAFDIEHLEQEGTLNANDGFAKISEFEDTAASKTSFDKMSVVGKHHEIHGELHLTDTVLKVDKTHFSKEAHEILADSTIVSKECIDESRLIYSGQSGVIADNYVHTGHVEKNPLIKKKKEETAKEVPKKEEKPKEEKEKDANQSEAKSDKKPEEKSKPSKKARKRKAKKKKKKEADVYFVQAKEATLEGSTNVDNAYYSIDSMQDGNDFIAGRGKYENYKASSSFSFETKEDLTITGPIKRDCDLYAKAKSVDMKADYDKAHDLTFVSTDGDVLLESKLKSKNVYVQSAKSVVNNNDIDAADTVSIEAKGSCINAGGRINGDTVAIKAADIKNITRDSEAAKTVNTAGLSIGTGGIINARTNLYEDTTVGNIENHGGIMRGGKYAQLTAEGDVLNICNEITYQGAHDIEKKYDGGLIAGGEGSKDNDNIGLYIKAKGKVISDASDFSSNGNNYIEGVQGVDFKERHHTYVSKDEWHKKWYGKKTHIIETSTTIKGTTVKSAKGHNMIRSGEGSVSAVGAQFYSPGGTDIYAKGDVGLYSVKANNRHYEFKSSWWGLNKEETDYVYDTSAPTIFADNGATHIISEEGDVDAQGAVFVGEGDLSIKAKHRIKLGLDILDHDVTTKSQGLGVSAPGMGAWNTCNHGGNVWDMATSEDATLSKLNSLGHSKNKEEVLANASNLGIDLYNTSSSVMRGLAGGTMGQEMMARYGMGGADGFAPCATFTYSTTSSHSKTQSQGVGGIDRGGNVKLEAGDGVDLNNGVKVHAGKDLEIDAPEVKCHAAKLSSSSSEHSESVSVSVSATGNIQSVGASASKSSSSSTHYENAELSAGGNVKLHHKGEAMDFVELDGANIVATSLDMKTKKLKIIDKQDISQNETKSASVSSSGQVSAYKGKGSSKKVSQHSGIAIKDGINNNGHVVEVGETYMEGGKIVTQGKNDFKTDKMEAVTLDDEEKYSGIGISGNVHDFERLGSEQAQNSAGENAIATFSINSDKVDYKAQQQATLYGDKGTHLDLKEQVGQVHSSSADGCIVDRDVNRSINVDVPLTNQDYLDKSVENIKAGSAKLKEVMAGDEPEVEVVYERSLAPEFGLPDANERTDEIDAQIDALNYDEQDEIEEKALKQQSKKSDAMAEVNDEIDALFDEKEQEYSPYKGLSFFNSAPTTEEDDVDATNEMDGFESSWQGRLVHAIDNPGETISSIARGFWSTLKEKPIETALDSTVFGTIDSAQATVSGYSFINRESVPFKTAAFGALPFFGLGFKVEKAAVKNWTIKARIKEAELPSEGRIRYIPKGSYHPSNPIPKGPNNGFYDKFGNEWTKGPSRTAGQVFEWDVQLSHTGKLQLGWASRDGSHINVSLDGRITHR